MISCSLVQVSVCVSHSSIGSVLNQLSDFHETWSAVGGGCDMCPTIGAQKKDPKFCVVINYQTRVLLVSVVMELKLIFYVAVNCRSANKCTMQHFSYI